MSSGNLYQKLHFRVFTLLAALFFFSPAPAAHGNGEVRRILVTPFAVFGPGDAREIRTASMEGLVSRLRAAEGLEVLEDTASLSLPPEEKIGEREALSMGRERKADFVVTGSVTVLGNEVSMDGTVWNLASGLRSDLFVQGKDPEKIRNLSRNMGEKILLIALPEQRIEAIRIKGNRKIESIAIQNVLGSRKGRFYDRSRVAEDIKNIYKMGYFRDVQVEKETGAEGLILTFVVEEKPLISEINIQGYDGVSRGDIEAVMTIKTRQILDLERVKGDVEKIKALYHDKGYRNVEVSYEIEETGKEIRVLIKIREYEKLYIRSIEFKGNQAFTEKELRSLIKTTEKGFFSFLTDSGLLKTDQLKEDTRVIEGFYQNHGYIEANVGEPEITDDRKWIYVTIPITEGKLFRVGTVAIEGDTIDVPREKLLEKLNIREKNYFSRESVMKDVDSLQEACNNEGYAYATVAPQTLIDDKEQRVDVKYLIEKKIPVYFNRITISGNTKTRDKVIRRELRFVEGDRYSREQMKASYMSLTQLRFFEEVNFQTEKGPDESLMDINIQVKEMATGMFSVGAGYSANENALFMAQIAQRNLFGRGQTLSLNGYFGSQTTNYELSWVEPWLFDMPLWSRIEAWKMDKDYDTYDLDTTGIALAVGYPLFEYVKGYVEYRLSTNDVYNIEEDASYYIKKQEGAITSSGVTLTLIRDTTDDWLFPSRGSKNSVSVQQTGTIFGGDAAFTKYSADSAWFFPLPFEYVFHVRGRIGYISPMEGKDVPIYERYYLGGISTLRGLRDIGPTDPETGDLLGGLTMLNFNVEVIFPILKTAGLKGVVFFDTGNAWESGYNLGDMRKTAGAGIRWYSPIGPLRLEWGYVLDRKDDESASRWEFTIGMFM
jgi:outer membrane protein insertion porin family